MTKHRLDFDVEFNFSVIGICSAVADYRLIWELNQVLGVNFKKSKNDYLKTHKKKNSSSAHSLYTFYDENLKSALFCIKNKNNSLFLIPELIQIDYFVFFNELSTEDMEDWLVKLRKCSCIQMAMEFFPEEHKSFETIAFDDYEEN